MNDHQASDTFPLPSLIPSPEEQPFSIRAHVALKILLEWGGVFSRASSRAQELCGRSLPNALNYFWYRSWAEAILGSDGQQFKTRSDPIALARLIERIDSFNDGYFGRAIDISPDEFEMREHATAPAWNDKRRRWGRMLHAYDEMLLIEEAPSDVTTGSLDYDDEVSCLTLSEFLQKAAFLLAPVEPSVSERNWLLGLAYYDSDGENGRGGPVFTEVVWDDFTEDPPKLIRVSPRERYHFHERRACCPWDPDSQPLPAWRSWAIDLCCVAIRQMAIQYGTDVFPTDIPRHTPFTAIVDWLIDRANNAFPLVRQQPTPVLANGANDQEESFASTKEELDDFLNALVADDWLEVRAGENYQGRILRSRVRSLGEVGTTQAELLEAGEGMWTELLRLPDGRFAFQERSWDEYQGTVCTSAQLVSENTAMIWLHENRLPRPDEHALDLPLINHLAKVENAQQDDRSLGNSDSTQAPSTQEVLPSHADDFTWVKCTHGDFTFTPTQAKAVAVLWTDWERKGAGLGSKSILKSSGTERTLVRDIFRAHRAWGTLIVAVPKRKGVYTLDLSRPMPANSVGSDAA